ncbi:MULTISPECIES: hypothetical protein [unclassified Sphingopyxis]|nr:MULTISPECIES: hypothetical protein [unclassified Sphingopyxis]
MSVKFVSFSSAKAPAGATSGVAIAARNIQIARIAKTPAVSPGTGGIAAM